MQLFGVKNKQLHLHTQHQYQQYQKIPNTHQRISPTRIFYPRYYSSSSTSVPSSTSSLDHKKLESKWQTHWAQQQRIISDSNKKVESSIEIVI
jgi:hypothetical protein